ncbi:hypothetical protein JCM8097_001935 [Rhodosporidiobolus ruineniae]
MAGAHNDLRARNKAFASKVGKSNPLNKEQKEDLTKPRLPKWLALSLILLVVGGVFIELLQAIYNAFFAVQKR